MFILSCCLQSDQGKSAAWALNKGGEGMKVYIV